MSSDESPQSFEVHNEFLKGILREALSEPQEGDSFLPPDWARALDFIWIPEKFVGRGGSGFVWKASHRETGEEVALKVIPFQGDLDVARERYFREVQVASSVEHRHLMGIRDSGLAPDGVSAWLALEWIEGGDLYGLLGKVGVFSWAKLAPWVEQICEGLTVLHEAGLVHRDLKPSNLLVEKETGRLVISDFGAALPIEEERVTRTSDVLLSFGYAAPEQLKPGKVIDGRADQYALANTIWELLTGELPMGSFPRLRSQGADAPRWLDSVLRRALSPSPEKRHSDIASFARELTGQPSRRRRLWRAVALVLLITSAVFLVPRFLPEPIVETKITEAKAFRSGFMPVVEGLKIDVQLDVTIQPDGLIKIITNTRSSERWKGMVVKGAFALLDSNGEARLIIVGHHFGVEGMMMPGAGSSRSDYVQAQIDPALAAEIADIKFMAHSNKDRANAVWNQKYREVPKQYAISLSDLAFEDRKRKAIMESQGGTFDPTETQK